MNYISSETSVTLL